MGNFILFYNDFCNYYFEPLFYYSKIDEYLEDTTQFIITNKVWDSNFDLAREINPKLQFVTPEWVFQCHNNQQLVDAEGFSIPSCTRKLNSAKKQ